MCMILLYYETHQRYMDSDDHCLYNRDMKIISPQDITAQVRFSNYFETSLNDSWPERVIGDLELILIVSGEYLYEDELHGNVSLSQGDVLLILPDVPHSFLRKDRLDGSCISCIHLECIPDGSYSGHDYRLSPEPELVTSFRTQQEFSRIDDLFRLCEDAFNDKGITHLLRANACADGILLLLFERWQRVPLLRYESRIELMIGYIKEHIDRPITRDELACLCSLSPEHCSRLFKQFTGLSISSFIQREKIHTAYRLMYQRGYSVKEAAFAVGYEDPAYFSRVYKKVLLTNPSTSKRS